MRLTIPEQKSRGKGNVGAPGGSRTHDPWLRKPILYPAELRAQATIITKKPRFPGRDCVVDCMHLATAPLSAYNSQARFKTVF